MPQHRVCVIAGPPVMNKAMSSNAGAFETVGKRKTFPARQVNKNAGRPNRLNAEAYDNLIRAYYSHPYSFRELADMFGVSRMTVWRAVQEAAPVGVRL